MENQDLRSWLARMEGAGELQHVSGAERMEEIGGIVDIYQRKMGRQALLFDDVPGYPRGYRVLANVLTSVRRIAMTLGLPDDATEMDLVRYWRNYIGGANTHKPEVVKTGKLLENVLYGKDIDLLKIPTPKWHEDDGGPYIGTGCMVIMKDPDSGWINYGAYRGQVFDKAIATVMCSKGKHGDLLMQKYFQRGERCPIAVVVGVHPALFMVAGLEIPYGKNEYEAAGALIGEPVQVIEGPITGLPIPAHAEIAYEGFVSPGDKIDEGPLGEWTGYYCSGKSPQPVIRVESMLHRNDPVLLGVVPAVPPNDDSYYRGHFRAGAVWRQLEGAGIPGVTGVWSHEAGGGRYWLTVAVTQMYPGHSKQVGLVAGQVHAAAYCNRYVVVVDDDINPANMDEVVWAMCTRVDPREDVEILKGCWSTRLDPMSYPEDQPVLNSRMVIDACRPWIKRDSFPAVARSSPGLDARIREKFGNVMPKGF